MIRSFLKRKLTDDQLANIFVNGLVESIDNSFDVVCSILNDDPSFISSPKITNEYSSEFFIIVLAGNLFYLEENFDSDVKSRLESLILAKCAVFFNKNHTEFSLFVKEYKSYISRVNHPSKNVVKGMSKALFFKYNLNEYQDVYFKNMQAPNPLFLKRMEDLFYYFIWDWDVFFKKYKV